MREPVRVLVLGASGMLGSAMLRTFSQSNGFDVIGAVRTVFPQLEALAENAKLIAGFDAENPDKLAEVFGDAQPDIVINAVGLIKQLPNSASVSSAVPINTLLPHRIQKLSEISRARLIHFSTDCVFSGYKGGYSESDRTDATDVYGLTKFLGEVSAPNALTIRTSIIGHELFSANGLVEWFLSRRAGIKGYTKAIFSGLPTVELARVVRDHVIPKPELVGVYHVSSDPISKYDLLRLIADAYPHDIAIEPDSSLRVDRSLNSDRFRMATGYVAPSWPELVKLMKNSRIKN